jgi:thioredoxin-related protein
MLCTLLSIPLLCLALNTQASDAPHPQETRDLVAEAQQMRARTLPLMLIFSSAFCGYCEKLDEEIVIPMLISGHYEDRVIIRKLMLDEWVIVRDFDGQRRESEEVSQRYRVPVVPTILFLDARGAEIAPRIVGVQSLEFLGGQVDEAIATALAHVKRQP